MVVTRTLVVGVAVMVLLMVAHKSCNGQPIWPNCESFTQATLTPGSTYVLECQAVPAGYATQLIVAPIIASGANAQNINVRAFNSTNFGIWSSKGAPVCMSPSACYVNVEIFLGDTLTATTAGSALITTSDVYYVIENNDFNSVDLGLGRTGQISSGSALLGCCLLKLGLTACQLVLLLMHVVM